MAIESEVIQRTRLVEQARQDLEKVNRLGTPKDITSIKLQETGNKSTKGLDDYRERVLPDYMGRNLDFFA